MDGKRDGEVSIGEVLIFGLVLGGLHLKVTFLFE
jgi:hypothetical protein